jgi:hypothetical protein
MHDNINTELNWEALFAFSGEMDRMQLSLAVSITGYTTTLTISPQSPAESTPDSVPGKLNPLQLSQA